MKKISESEWNKITINVTKLMAKHIQQFVTPISKVFIDEVNRMEYGEHHGSGSFVEINGSKFLITNEHVAREISSNSLAHQFYNSNCVIRITNEFHVIKYPTDVAITKIDDNAWNICKHDSNTIPLNRFMLKHKPVKGELLFIIGYSGARSRFVFNTLVNPGTPYLTQEKKYLKDYNEYAYHFAIHYEPEKAIKIEDNSRELPAPPGLSGSLVWNTRFVEHSLKQKLVSSLCKGNGNHF